MLLYDSLLGLFVVFYATLLLTFFFFLVSAIDLCVDVVYSQKAALVLNASRRFRYTLDLKKEQETREMRQKIRGHAHALLVSFFFI